MLAIQSTARLRSAIWPRLELARADREQKRAIHIRWHKHVRARNLIESGKQRRAPQMRYIPPGHWHSVLPVIFGRAEAKLYLCIQLIELSEEG